MKFLGNHRIHPCNLLFSNSHKFLKIQLALPSPSFYLFHYFRTESNHCYHSPNMSRHPTLKWAQREDLLFITIELPDAKDVKLILEPKGRFFFSATSGIEKIPYEININLYDNVDVNESKVSIGSRNIVYLVKKEESKWWRRLLKQEGKTPVFIKVDWNRWVDEDEQDEQAGPDMEYDDVNFSSLGLGGAGSGEDFDEEDDDSDIEQETEIIKEEQTVSHETGAGNSHVEAKA